MNKKVLSNFILALPGSLLYLNGFYQLAPAEEENIPYLITFWGDSDKSEDEDGFIRGVSVAKRGELCTISEDVKWTINEPSKIAKVRNSSMEIQFIKNREKLVKNDNVVVIVQNQDGESLQFCVIPIGGIPVYNPALRMKAAERK